jgi:hypothetical protein
MQVFVALEAEIIISIFAMEDFLVFSHRVLNDLWRTRLSRRRFGSSPTPLPLPSVSSIGDTQEEGEERQLADGGVKIIRRRVNMVLYKSFNILMSSAIADFRPQSSDEPL